MSLRIAVLAGGQSRRMGRDKALLPLGDTTLLARTAAVAAQALGEGGAQRVAIAGRARPDDWPDAATVFLPDDTPDLGPLGGIDAALRWAEADSGDRICILPCDLPRLTSEAIHWLLDVATDADVGDGAAVRGADGRIEPLFAVYATQCRPAIAALLSGTGRRRSPTALLESGDFRILDAPPFVIHALADADTPEAWAALTGKDLPAE